MGEFITTLFEALTEGITGIIAPIIDAVKTGFLELIYVDPSAEVKEVSAIAYFLFAMLGLSVGVGLVWLVMSLFKRRG